MEPTNGHAQFEVVARLTPAEFTETRKAAAILDQLDTERRLAQAGSQMLWSMLREKYRITPDVMYDPATGVFLRSPSDAAVSSPLPEPETVFISGGAPDDSLATVTTVAASTPNRAQRRKRGKK